MPAISFHPDVADAIATELGKFLMQEMSTLGETPTQGKLRQFQSKLTKKIDAIYNANSGTHEDAIVLHTSATSKVNWDPGVHSIVVVEDEVGNSGKMRVVYPGFAPDWYGDANDNARELGLYFLKKCR